MWQLRIVNIAIAVVIGTHSKMAFPHISSGDKEFIVTGSLNGAPFILDPAQVLDSSQWHTLTNLGVNLVSHDKEGRLIGVGAESWKISPNFSEFIFHLRNDIRDSNGELLDSSDWKASFLHLLRSGG